VLAGRGIGQMRVARLTTCDLPRRRNEPADDSPEQGLAGILGDLRGIVFWKKPLILSPLRHLV